MSQPATEEPPCAEDGQIRAQFKIERLSAEQGWRVTQEGIALDDTAC